MMRRRANSERVGKKRLNKTEIDRNQQHEEIYKHTYIYGVV